MHLDWTEGKALDWGSSSVGKLAFYHLQKLFADSIVGMGLVKNAECNVGRLCEREFYKTFCLRHKQVGQKGDAETGGGQNHSSFCGNTEMNINRASSLCQFPLQIDKAGNQIGEVAKNQCLLLQILHGDSLLLRQWTVWMTDAYKPAALQFLEGQGFFDLLLIVHIENHVGISRFQQRKKLIMGHYLELGMQGREDCGKFLQTVGQ